MKPPVPKYFVIKSLLQGRFDPDSAPGDTLRSEYALCAEFGVSSITAQRTEGGVEITMKRNLVLLVSSVRIK
jgi:hypothetical protein